MSVEIKDFPFCGSEAHGPIKSGSSDERDGYNFTVSIKCSKCGAGVCKKSNQDSGGWCNDTGQALAGVIAAWNLRVIPSAASAAPADEKPNCRMQGGICACRSGGSYGGCAIERQASSQPLFANDRTIDNAGSPP